MHKTNRVVSHLIEIRYIYVRLQSGSENGQSIQEIHYYATISNARKIFFFGWMRERILVWCHIPSERHHHIASFIAYDPSTRIPNEMINIIYLIVANQRPNAWMKCVLGQRPVDIVDDLIETTHRTEW